MVSFTAVALFATSALAVPVVERQIEIPVGWTWSVTNWVASCSRASGCYYNFDIAVPAVEGLIGGVEAHCDGYETGSTFQSCRITGGANNGVAAKFLEREDPGNGEGPKQFAVSFLKASYEGSIAYNFTAFHDTVYTTVLPPQNLTLTPTQVFAIA
ncbi:hypothetical protein F4778DRAFT_675574 [Xylariomycetidae sp. FL2044]|nr:hypothetical protein F4778DRAFT_675574 [Xylariomycetidae sp. FL2044]